MVEHAEKLKEGLNTSFHSRKEFGVRSWIVGLIFIYKSMIYGYYLEKCINLRALPRASRNKGLVV